MKVYVLVGLRPTDASLGYKSLYLGDLIVEAFLDRDDADAQCDYLNRNSRINRREWQVFTANLDT
jgi:hypothetical protein